MAKKHNIGRNAYLGTVFILIGLIWMLRNFGYVSGKIFSTVFSWQMLVVALGGYLITSGKKLSGIVVAGIGIFYLLRDFFGLTMPVSDILIPAIIIVLGVALLITKR